ncbi:hypothetical protein GCM10010294_57570 [Streptomyces griseoloalbus]|nr:hypothetical protein GCM10010294_57570 [Streptomyces griseoloalbus]
MPGITYVRGDATVPSVKGVKIVAHVRNDLGGWGKGFVLALSRRWPEPEAAYRAWHPSTRATDRQTSALRLLLTAGTSGSPHPALWTPPCRTRAPTTGQKGGPVTKLRQRHPSCNNAPGQRYPAVLSRPGQRPHTPSTTTDQQ